MAAARLGARTTMIGTTADVLGIKRRKALRRGLNAHCLPEDIYRHEALLAKNC
jgi:hypothetical protein